MRLDTSIDERKSRDTFSSEDKVLLCEAIPVVVNHIKKAVDAVPPTNKKLLDDKTVVEASSNVSVINDLEKETIRINRLIKALDSSESAIRDSIRLRTDIIIKAISTDIQALWAKLHPKEPIEDVKLYLPEDQAVSKLD